MVTRRTRSAGLARLAAVGLGLALFAPGVAGADGYDAQVVLRAGTPAGDFAIGEKWALIPGALNDRGHLAVVAGGTPTPDGGVLLQYADGRWTTVAVHGQPGPRGTWPVPMFIGLPLQMNAAGDIAFLTEIGRPPNVALEAYRWDFAARTVIPVGVKGLPAGETLILEQGAEYAPSINNRGEIAFSAGVKNAAGKLAQGIFLMGSDGKIQPLVLPEQEMPGGRKLQMALLPSLNDAGAVAFLAATPNAASPDSAYLWENGTVTPIVAPGGTTVDGRKVREVWSVKLNNRNRTALVTARVEGVSGFGLYRFTEGKLVPLVVRGQEMPGGGKFTGIDTPQPAVSWANEAGQHAFYASEGGVRAVYRIDPDGALTPVLKSRSTTHLGTITHIGSGESFGIALNNRGQIAVTVRIDSGPASLILLTPTP
jgi:hypothetical protein